MQIEPTSPLFQAISIQGNVSLAGLEKSGLPADMARNLAKKTPQGACGFRGIPFILNKLAAAKDHPLEISFKPVKASWLVFLHTADLKPDPYDAQGFIPHSAGHGRLAEPAAAYLVRYQDGTEVHAEILRRHEIGAWSRPWGEINFQSLRAPKPTEDDGQGPWFLWAWENPHPEKAVSSVRVEPKHSLIVVAGLSAGKVKAHPLRWNPREKAVLKWGTGKSGRSDASDKSDTPKLKLDLGVVISVRPRLLYPTKTWPKTYDAQVPEESGQEYVVEYTAHPEARFLLPDGKAVPAAKVGKTPALRFLPPARLRVTIKVLDQASKRPVAVRLHLHGQGGEYLPPLDRHRVPDTRFNEDRSVDWVNGERHFASYVDGEAEVLLPLGPVYLEASRGFEVKPVRRIFHVTPATRQITVLLKKELRWRERGWVSADTHVHFLSPQSALLEGAGEGVNVVNLLASQWGDLMTNVGDFDGRTTWGSKEAGGDGEHLVRVGTENRQHLLGHISLLGYSGRPILPMTTGGPEESSLGDSVDSLLTEWAAQCRKQGGLVVIPHFPDPRAEHAATIVAGKADAVEMTSWFFLYNGIDPYSLSDWYRYLNCGYLVAAVGGTDKMSANTAVGTVRTYARLKPGQPFTYEAWKQAVRRAQTFVTFGPLMEFSVEGKPPGSWIQLGNKGGTVDVSWKLASVTVPMTRVELIVNGEIRKSEAVKSWQAEGHWSVKLERSSWVALLVRGHQPGKPQIIAAHSSPVMVKAGESPFFAAADALTILDQIEGSLAWLDVLGTRAETRAYKRMRMVLTSAHRDLHNRLHEAGRDHRHTPATNHNEHRS
jgi:hypothetical protein